MYVTKSIDANHEDLIHDVAYDFYGKRMATCSSDQKVKVWDQQDSGEWVCSASWKSHYGSVWKVNWAHPEFGQVMKGEMKVGKIRRGNFQVIATCSFDRTAAVWEEIVGEKSSGGLNHWVNPAASLKLSFIKFLFITAGEEDEPGRQQNQCDRCQVWAEAPWLDSCHLFC